MAKDHTKIFVLLLCVSGILSATPPRPVCRPTPVPTTIPLSIGETARFDLEDIFEGTSIF